MAVHRHFVVVYLVIARRLYLRPTGIGHYDALLTTALVALPLAVAIAIVLFETVEKPFLRLRPRYVGAPVEACAAAKE